MVLAGNEVEAQLEIGGRQAHERKRQDLEEHVEVHHAGIRVRVELIQFEDGSVDVEVVPLLVHLGLDTLGKLRQDVFVVPVGLQEAMRRLLHLVLAHVGRKGLAPQPKAETQRETGGKSLRGGENQARRPGQTVCVRAESAQETPTICRQTAPLLRQ